MNYLNLIKLHKYTPINNKNSNYFFLKIKLILIAII